MTTPGTGFVVLHHESDLGLIAACFGVAVLGKAARAHYPQITTRDAALQQAAADFGTVPGHLVLSYGEAMERVRELVKARRAKTAARQRQRRVRG